MRLRLAAALLCLIVPVALEAQTPPGRHDVGPVPSGTEVVVSFPSDRDGASNRSTAPEELTLLVTGYDFGSQRVGTRTRADSAVRILNIGGPVVTIAAVTLTGDAEFTMNTSGVVGSTIGPGETLLLPVTFEPTAVKTYSASVSLTFDPDQGGSYTAPLVGAGNDSVSSIRTSAGARGLSALLDRGGSALRVRGVSSCNDLAVALVAADGRVVASWEHLAPDASRTLRLDIAGVVAGWHRLVVVGCGRSESVTVVR